MKRVNWPAANRYSAYASAIVKKLDTLRALVIQAQNCSTTQQGRRDYADCGTMDHVNEQLTQLMAFLMGDGDTSEVAQRIDADLADSLKFLAGE